MYYSWTPTLGLSCNNCPNPLATPLTTTKYYVTVSDSLGCSSADSVTITVDPCVGITENGNSPALKLHPNPSTGKFTLQALNLPEENVGITIFDIHGKAVYVQSLKTDEGKLLHNIQLENIPAGVYQIQIESGNVLKKEKLILQ